MSDHYFSPRPASKREDRTFQAEILGDSFIFQTDAGVFSKKGVDFGSRLLLETVEITPSIRSILDLGCGYGLIGTVLAKVYAQDNITMADVNERAVTLATENAVRNGVSNQTKQLVSDGFQALDEQCFDLILLNPPIRTGKENVYRLFAEAYEHLNPNGSLWIVIRKKQGAASAFKELERLSSEVIIRKQKKGFEILQVVKD
ncbi:class I SAM-dependent methyltransferase [Hazenella sp. IB182357]|uniref:Class I SAM-dependent methyltransferase n=1 Tax=Polycladospora coralii TaxID=2771432 RepID=A0A926RXC1_9BACL|nr:methyltransferase [Polycladospora coralii]MBD1372376.1 class I SAM-dependent methyltransferase [Polycladospora coralii]MBS7531434.1 class I SAM-dependent methyltransferase [Polycladospora coralii]